MYAIEKELRILRQFISPKHMEGLKKWKCYSEDEILAAEKRLHVKLTVVIFIMLYVVGGTENDMVMDVTFINMCGDNIRIFPL